MRTFLHVIVEDVGHTRGEHRLPLSGNELGSIFAIEDCSCFFKCTIPGLNDVDIAEREFEADPDNVNEL